MKLFLLALVPLAACSSTPTSGCICSEVGILSTEPSLDFGDVAVGNSETRKLVLANEGAGSLAFLDSSIEGDTGVSFSIADGGVSVLAPGQMTSWTVVFSPSAAGTFAAQLDIPNDGETPSVVVQLTGTGIDLDCRCAPTALSFAGDAGVTSQTVTCSNSGTTACLLTTDPSDTSAAFALTDANGPVSSSDIQTLAPAATYDLTVTFDPSVDAGLQSSFTDTACANTSTCLAPQVITLAGTAASS